MPEPERPEAPGSPAERRPSIEALYAAIVESSDDAVLGQTLDGVITSFNRGASRMYGYEPDEIIGQHMSVLVPPDRTGELESMLDRLARGERIEHHETARRRKDGSTVEVSVTVSPIRDEDGTILGASAIARDITTKRGLEELRRQSDERELAILQSVPIILFAYDLDGRVTSYRAGGALPDMEVRNPLLIDATIHELYRDEPEFLSVLVRALDGERASTEYELLGHIFEVRLAPEFDALGRQIGVTGVSIEISERVAALAEQRQLADRLARYERLESLGQLAGGIAHDFNNLLGVIINCASFVADELDDHDAARADVHQIERAADRATQLTRQLLAFARRDVLQPQVVDLNHIVTSVEAMLRRTLGEHVIVVTDLAEDLWPVLVDPGQFEQVFVNLAVNARDAMPLGGTLTVDTCNVDIDAEYGAARPGLVAGRYVRLRVSDDGVGIDEHVVVHVFEPFFTTKLPGEGTGLGLASVFGIVSQAGGDVQLYSQLGTGTTVRVLLPAAGAVETDPPHRPASGPTGGTETILVVEDEDALREVIRRILSQRGYRVLVTASGEEAERMLVASPTAVDLLLTDVVMPHMLGIEVAERIHALDPAVRVLYMSGHAHPVLGPILDRGASLLEKPFSEDTLLSKLREVLDRSS